ncbi:juvenile hormone esterase-like [Epargyreus clarus]|uniref:juvenile hormone esterase-like n=1 Tax=Epargyreus clarus TaxID=520877 RepID=UPI003C2D5D6E
MVCKTGVLAALLLTHVCVSARSEPVRCAARAQLDSGWVCGARRWTPNGTEYASFLAVPYAKQPLGELRFQELQPVEPWEYLFEATQEGPICPQRDVFYGPIMKPENTAVTEACIHANIHVPMYALPESRQDRMFHEFRPPHYAGVGDDDAAKTPGLPIIVFVHGGGFGFGSGDTDLYGPEYLIGEDVIIITFNYRLNVFGFLSLNNSYIPGNNGLRDIVTLLRWVRSNAKAFGGNPDDVTLAGHSAGAASTHLLTLSKAAEGLFNRALLMSGTAIPSFYTTSPAYAQFVSNVFLTGLGIDSKNPEEVHNQLIEMPLEKLMQVHNSIQDQFGISVFFPVVETPFPNFTTILTDDPETLLAKGEGKDIPLMVGFTNAECYSMLPRLKEIDIMSLIKTNPILIESPQLIYTKPQASLDIARQIQARYFHGEPTIEQYIKSCTDSNFIYPAMKVAQIRAKVGGAPLYLYEFSYEGDFSVIKEANKINFKGAAHLDDVTYAFRVNSILGPDYKASRNDRNMQHWMVHFVKNFIRCSDPACNRDRRPSFATPWPPFTKQDMMYQGISMPVYRTLELNNKQLEMVRFFDSLGNRTS